MTPKQTSTDSIPSSIQRLQRTESDWRTGGVEGTWPTLATQASHLAEALGDALTLIGRYRKALEEITAQEGRRVEANCSWMTRRAREALKHD
jgi:hypothetical protein